MKVKNTLFFILAIFAVIAIVMLIFPKDGIKIGDDFVLECPSFDNAFFSKKTDTASVDIDSLLANQIDIDEHIPEIVHNQLKEMPEYTEQPDPTSDKIISDHSANYNIEDIKSTVTPLEMSENSTALNHFFKKLSTHGEYEKIRILHYGDSQLEGDRISSYIRYKLQGRFGGFGVGMSSPVAIYAQYSIKQEASDGWIRCPGFGKRNSEITHKKYGPMMAFDRFSPIRDSLWKRPQEPYSAWLKFSKSNMGYTNTRKFKNIYVYYGNCTEDVNITIKNNGEIINQGRMEATPDLNVYAYKSPTYLDEITLEFEAFDSPDIYTISLEDDKGIYVDNIAMRGCSGEVFTGTDRALLAESFKELGADLFILQFGANAVPNMKDTTAAKKFVNFFMAQVRAIRAMCPEASFIVVGPNDMSVKNADVYESYPILDTMVNMLCEAALKNNCAFWNTYKAMGGRNSMPKWAEAEPALAAKDYTHFSPQGAQIISNMFYNAIIVEYTNYLQRNKR